MALDASEGWIVMTNDDGRLEAAPIDNLTEVAFQLIRDVDPMNMNDYFRHSYEQVCLLYTSPSPRDATLSRMPSSA